MNLCEENGTTRVRQAAERLQVFPTRDTLIVFPRKAYQIKFVVA